MGRAGARRGGWQENTAVYIEQHNGFSNMHLEASFSRWIEKTAS